MSTPRERASITLEAVNSTRWSEAHEEFVKRWDQEAGYYQAIHTRASQNYATKHMWMGGTTVFVGAALTGAEFASISATGNTSFSIALACLAMIMTGLVALGQYLEFGPLSISHRHKAGRYYAICQNLREMMTFPREDREPVRTFMHRIKEQFIEMNSDDLAIPDWMITEFVRKMETVLKDDKIEICVGEPVQSVQPCPDEQVDSSLNDNGVDQRVTRSVIAKEHEYQLKRFNELGQ